MSIAVAKSGAITSTGPSLVRPAAVVAIAILIVLAVLTSWSIPPDGAADLRHDRGHRGARFNCCLGLSYRISCRSANPLISAPGRLSVAFICTRPRRANPWSSARRRGFLGHVIIYARSGSCESGLTRTSSVS